MQQLNRVKLLFLIPNNQIRISILKCLIVIFYVEPLPPLSVTCQVSYMRRKNISIEVRIYSNPFSVQSHYHIGCSSQENITLCRQTYYIKTTAGMLNFFFYNRHWQSDCSKQQCLQFLLSSYFPRVIKLQNLCFCTRQISFTLGYKSALYYKIRNFDFYRLACYVRQMC